MSDGRWKRGSGLGKFKTIVKREVGERVWEVGEGLVEPSAEMKFVKILGKFFNWMIEIVSKAKVGERGWQIVNRVVKFLSQKEVSKGGREVVNGMVEMLAQSEVGEGRGEVVNWLVKF